MTIKRIESNNRVSRAVVGNGQVFVTGQVATDTSKDISGQTQEVLDKIDDLLNDAGTDRSQLLFTQIWLKNIETDFAPMNIVWENWILGMAPPARATVESKMAGPQYLVEIAATALAKG